jgi:hypothetical protein
MSSVLVAVIEIEAWLGSVIVPAKPFRLVRVRVEVPELPWLMLRLVGLAEIPKSPATVTVTAAEWLSPPPVPLTVTV